MSGLAVLLLAAPGLFESFDEPLDPLRWYVGAPAPPQKGALRLPRRAWIAARHVPDDVEAIEIDFEGRLVVTFHDEREPLTSPVGEVRAPAGRGVRTLRVDAAGARVGDTAVPLKGERRGAFRLAGAATLHEVRVLPRVAEPPEPTVLEKRTVLYASAPPRFRDGDKLYVRRTFPLWDAEVCFLFRHGASGFRLLRGEAKGAPVLGALVSAGDPGKLPLRAAGHALAMADWGDERRNLDAAAFTGYLRREYARFELLQHAQRVLNAAAPERDDLEPLVHLAVIRHSANARAATALAETQGAKAALKALRAALPRDVPLARASADQLRAAAAAAARTIVGETPAAWPGFRFDPSSRYTTLQTAEDLVR